MRKTLRIALTILALLNLAAFIALFAGVDAISPLVRSQFVPAMLRLDFVWLGIIVALTALFGRFYCEAMCPLGVWQDVLRLGRPRRVCCRLPVGKIQWAVRGLVALAALALPWALDPYAIFARAATGAEPVVFALVSILAICGKGRIWCNWICPAGTVFALTQLPRRRNAKFTRFDSHCQDCRACWPTGKEAAK